MPLTRFRIVAVFLAFAQFLAASDPPSKLLTRWRSLKTSSGGIGSMLQFHQDGAVDFSPGAVVTFSYRVEGNQLVMTPPTGAEQKLRFELVNDNVVRLKPASANATNESTDLVRIGVRTNAGKPLAGEWIENRKMGGQELKAQWIFDSSDKLLLLIPFTAAHGHFSINGDTIHVDLPNQEPMEGRFEFDGDVLILPGNKTGQFRYASY